MRLWRREHAWGKRWGVLALACLLSGCGTAGSLRVVNVPVADLRGQPGPLAASLDHDPLQETQLLYGERVRVTEVREAWALVEAIEQPEFTHAARWRGYPGWILQDLLRPARGIKRPTAVVTARWATLWKDALGLDPWFQVPMGTPLSARDEPGVFRQVTLLSGQVAWVAYDQIRLRKELRFLTGEQKRQLILHAATALVGDPYFWGGRSPQAGPQVGTQITGVDCSGLVNLAYRSAGIAIPRDAHEQYLRAQRVSRLQPADLIFLSEADNPKKIVHVMLYAGDGWIVEGPGTGLTVRRIELTERLGSRPEQLKPGMQIGKQTVYFGTYLR